MSGWAANVTSGAGVSREEARLLAAQRSHETIVYALDRARKARDSAALEVARLEHRLIEVEQVLSDRRVEFDA